MKKRIIYSSPGKVILSGEHAVVWGKPAIVCAIDLRLKFTLWECDKKNVDKTMSLLSQKVKNYLEKQKIKYIDKNFDFEINSQIPVRRGLGSSAALSAATSGAFLEFYTGRQFGNEIINNVAYQGEKYFHKNASGVDVAASCFGGLIYYRKEFDFLKNISALNFKIPRSIEDNLYLVDSGRSEESTAELVNSVGEAINKKPRFVEEVLNDIEKTTKRMVVSFIKEDAVFFQKSLVDNQIYLEMLGVVSGRAKKILKQLELYGVGKITGAGGQKKGSGYILFYPASPTKLKEYCEKEKLSYLKFKQSVGGVLKERS